MAFEFLSGSSGISNFIFNEVLKISPSLISKYTTVQDQSIMLILLPHLILFMFLFSFGWGLMPQNRGLRYVISVVTYIYIMSQGWYGSIIVPVSLAWYPILLIAAIFIFFAFKIIHPVTVGKLANVGASFAKDAGKHLGKDKEIERLYREIENIDCQLKKQSPNAATNSGAASAVMALEGRRFEIMNKIKHLEGDN
jgi:hypothetical protein